MKKYLWRSSPGRAIKLIARIMMALLMSLNSHLWIGYKKRKKSYSRGLIIIRFSCRLSKSTQKRSIE
jgi:hypothetical protein